MAYPDITELPTLLKKWSKHYGFREIRPRESSDPKKPILIDLMYKNGFRFHFIAADIEEVRKKIVANKPKGAGK